MNYFNLISRAAHIGATIAAAVVAVGATIGFHDMTGSWMLAALGGVGIASLLALGWYGLITLGARARRAPVKLFTVGLGILLVIAALGTSGWALATAIGGKEALAEYQTQALTEHEVALAAAGARLAEQGVIVDAVLQHEVAARLLAQEEGRTGQGPNFRSYQRHSENLLNQAGDMSATLEEAALTLEQGQLALDRANQSLGNAEAFRLAVADVQKVIIELNGVNIADDLLRTGMVGLNDRGLPELDGQTRALREVGEGAEFAPVATPRYIPMSRSDAVMELKPLGPWIAAIAIDAAPLLLLLMVMLAVSEPLLREERKFKMRKTDDEIRAEEDIVEGNITQFRQPAE